MTRNRILLGVLLVGAAVLMFIPFGRAGRGRSPVPQAKEATLAPLISYVEDHYESPADYVVGAFSSHEIVFLGEYGKIRENVDLVARLIPRLYRKGVRSLGIEYALSSDQPLINRLITAPTYDEETAKKVLFDYLVIWGYREYADLFRAAWQFNRTLPAGEQPFQIVALNAHQNWQYIKTKKDAESPEILHKVFAEGVPDVHMASIIERRFLSLGEKALIYLNTRSAFTAYQSPQYAANMRKMGFAGTKRVGSLIYTEIGNRSFTILFHQPWPSSGARGGAVYPLGGVLDSMIAKLPPDYRKAGFNVRGSVFGRLPLRGSDFSKEGSATTFGDLCDGYIIQGKLSDYHPVTPIADFITSGNVKIATEDFPGPKVAELTPENLNRFISGDLSNLGRFLNRFQ